MRLRTLKSKNEHSKKRMIHWERALKRKLYKQKKNQDHGSISKTASFLCTIKEKKQRQN